MPIPTYQPDLQINKTPGAGVERLTDGGWKLSLPTSNKKYHCSQLDDYKHLDRSDFAWTPGSVLSLEARVSQADLKGTWGFGFWNDPFQVRFGIKGGSFSGRRLPVLPNSTWFFYAAPPNYLTFRDNHPSQGLLAAVFSSALIPSWILGLGVPVLPLLGIPLTARYIRKCISNFINEDAKLLQHDVTSWNNYEIHWNQVMIEYMLNGEIIWCTRIVPKGRLGFLIWIDNQYAAFSDKGVFKTGLSEISENHWLEVKNIRVKKTS